MRRWNLALSVLAVALPFANGCGGGSGGGAQNISNLPPAVQAAFRSSGNVPTNIVTANNTLGMQLLAQMRKTDAGKNVFISPASVALALEIVYNGAAGSTLSAMGQTLNLGSLSVSDMNNANAALQASLVSTDPAVQLTVANSFWYHPATNQILPSFITTNTQYYGSQIGDLSSAPANINAWASAQTNGKITNIVGSDVSQEVAVVVNAVYFKGLWSQSFDATQTVSAPFTLADGTSVSCSMMNRQDVFSYYKGDTFQAVQLPYGNKRLTMLVFLPNSGVSLDSLIAEITPASLTTWMPQFTPEFGAVALPKFVSKYTSNLKPVLTALGMGVAFDANNANFSNMGPGLFIDSAVHQSYVSVDENGTVATGTTTIGVGTTSAPVNLFTMQMNHPFICAILDTTTNEILFYGAIDNPVLAQ